MISEILAQTTTPGLSGRSTDRISAIRNCKGVVIGLTCRVGHAIYGTIEIIKDIVTSDQSILLLGRPGVGKTQNNAIA